MVDPVKSRTKVDLNYSSLLPHLQITLYEECATQRRASQVPRPFLLANRKGLPLGGWMCFHWVVGSTPMPSIKRPRRTDTRCSKTFESIGVKEIGLELDAEEEGGPFGIGVTLATL